MITLLLRLLRPFPFLLGGHRQLALENLGLRQWWAPPLDAEIAALIRKMAAANPLWGAPRIHGELLKLAINVTARTVSIPV